MAQDDRHTRPVPRNKNRHGHIEWPGLSKLQHQVASITSEVWGTVSPYSNFTSGNEKALAGYTVLTTANSEGVQVTFMLHARLYAQIH